jgi:glycosyltransferase involved in cell wall biosynthesis
MGPVGGSLSTPPGFTDDEGSAPWYVGLRALDRWRIAHDPWLRRTYTEAACVLGIAPYVRDFLGDLPIRRFESLSETAIDGVPPRLDRSDRRGPVRLLYVGRLVRTKGARDAVRALAQVPDATVVLDVVGDGFDREACETEARELGVADRVVFHGRLPREEIDPLYRAADVFVFPSYREPGGNVTFEAMSWSLPLVVSDRGGPGTVVDDTCGIRVHPETPEAYATDLARAITRLVQNADERHKLGEGAWRRVQEVGLWDAKVRQVGALFEELATS